MMIAPVRKYLLTGLSGTPVVLEALLEGLAEGDRQWDVRPDPERFTLREILAHLADWESIYRERLQRMCAEEEPFIEDRDEGALAIERDYAHIDPLLSLSRFRTGREELMQFLRKIPEESWGRYAMRENLGRLSVAEQAVVVLGHDGYHTQQVAQWLGHR